MKGQVIDTLKKAKRTTVNPFADHGDLYLLVIGIIVGVLIGPGVLGRLAPKVYDGMYSSPDAVTLSQMLKSYRDNAGEKLKALHSSGVSNQHVMAMTRLWGKRVDALAAALTRARESRAVALALALTIGLAAAMFFETVLSPDPTKRKARVPAMLGRLVTVRYGLMAAWLAVVISRPSILTHGAIVLAGAVVLLSLVVGLVPLGPVGVVGETDEAQSANHEQ